MQQGTAGFIRHITAERVDKALNPLYLRKADTNLFDIRYASTSPVDSIFAYSAPDARARPLFKDVVPAALESNLFSPVVTGHAFGPSWSTHWLRVVCMIPTVWKDQVSTQIHLLFDSNSEAMLYTADGAPLQGFTGGDALTYRGNRRAEFVLTKDIISSVDAEGRITFFIEIACNGMFGCGAEGMINPPDEHRTFTLTKCELALLNEDANALFWDFVVLRDLAEHLGSDSYLAERALYAANQILNTVAKDSTSIAAARKIAQDVLSSFTEGSGSKTAELGPTVAAVGHCHIDTAWLWPFDETRRKVLRSWVTQLRYMKTECRLRCAVSERYTFAASQMVQFDWLLSDHPETAADIQTAVAKARFVPVGATWVEPDTNIPSGESLIRQFLYGSQYERDTFAEALGAAERAVGGSAQIPARIPFGQGVFWLPDTFGYSAQLPQIIRGCGMRYLLTQKLSWSLVNKPEHNTFWWHGLDGSSVLVHFPPADDYNAQAGVLDVWKTSQRNKDKSRTETSVMLFGNGDGGGGPNLPMFEQLQRLGITSDSKPCNGMPALRFMRPRDFFDQLAAEVSKREVAIWEGELFLELHQGTLTSQAAVKRLNRHCETLLHDAELLCAILWLQTLQREGTSSKLSKDGRKEVMECWKALLLCQFHDVLPGSSIAEVYRDSHSILESTVARLETIIASGLEYLVAELVDTNHSSWLAVNTCAHPRREVLQLLTPTCPVLVTFDFEANSMKLIRSEDIADNVLGVQKLDVTAVPTWPSEKSVTLAPGLVQVYSCIFRDGGIEEECIVLDNSVVEVYLSRRSGMIVSMLDRRVDHRTPREVIRRHLVAGADGTKVIAGGNALMLYSDVPWYWDAWDLFPYHKEKGMHVNWQPPTIELTEMGPVRAKLRVTSPRVGTGSKMTQDIVLTAYSASVQFDCEVDWQESHQVLKVEFPIDIKASTATFEVQFGCMERPTHDNTSRDAMQYEVCAHRFADVSGPDYGVSLVNDSKYGHSCKNSILALTLLRSPKAPDPACDMGVHNFRFALIPHLEHVKNSDIVKLARNFNSPIRLARTNAISLPADIQCPFFTITTPPSAARHHCTVVMDTVKLSEDGQGIVLRLYESLGHHQRIVVSAPFAFSKLEAVNMLEQTPEHEGLPTGEDVAAELLDCAPIGVKDAFDRHPLPPRPVPMRVSFFSWELDVRPFQVITLKATPQLHTMES